jgi:energy-coupling factor transporter ATP-binding protein EcfA2
MMLPVPKQDERLACVGKTGSGKTELLKTLFVAKANAHLVDTKLAKAYRDGGGIGEEVFGRNIYRSKYMGPGRYVWHTPDDFNLEYNPDSIEEYCNAIYQIGNRVVAFDEMLDVATAQTTLFSFHRMYTRGRERGIGVWAGMQRPAGVPPVARTEVEHKYCFYLEDPDDQERMEAAFGGYPLPWNYLKKHRYSFFYCGVTGDVHGPFRLRLGTAGEVTAA